jgi:photosynthetic reaction center H subunit
MGTGAITQYVDVAQLVLYMFWAFFAGLIYYLVRENHREGYPMDSGRNDSSKITGWPLPPTKVFKTEHGDMIAPNPAKGAAQPAVTPINGFPGTAFEPIGDPMLASVGAGSWTLRADHPDSQADGTPRTQPMRLLTEYTMSPNNVDPRGVPVYGADGKVAGTVTDCWLDVSDMLIRYLEVKVDDTGATPNVLLPINFARVKNGDLIGNILKSLGAEKLMHTGRGAKPDARIEVGALLASQFAQVPRTKSMDQVTLQEEERITAYYGGGQLYATPDRVEPLV